MEQQRAHLLGGPGSIRWDSVDDYIEVWDGTQWRNLSTGEIEWETIPAADNADWAQDVIRTKAATSDVAVRLGRSIIFEAGTQNQPNRFRRVCQPAESCCCNC